MKICFITDNIFTLGGIQRVVSVIASELTSYYDVEVLCVDKKGEIDRSLYNLNKKVNVEFKEELLDKRIITKVYSKLIKEMNKRTELLNNEKYTEFLKSKYYHYEMQNDFIKYLNSKNYDVIIGVAGYYSLLIAIISNKLNAKTIGWQHNSYDAYLKNRGRYHWHQDQLFNKYIPRLNKYLVLTEYDRRMFLKENNIESVVMYNPRSFNSEQKSDVSKKQFLAAGRFTYQKGFDLLIESFYEFSKKNNDWNLIIVGEGEEKDKILQKINKYKLTNRISIEKFTSNIKQYFLDSSVLLLSSRWEGMPMIVLESLEMGVPIVSYDITAIEALVTNEQEGLIIKKFDINDFARGMHRISQSYEMRQKLARCAIEKSEKFGVKNIVDQWKKLFEELS